MQKLSTTSQLTSEPSFSERQNEAGWAASGGVLARSPWTRRGLFFLVAGILGVAAFFRLWHLETIPGINGDEAWLGWRAVRAAEGLGLDWKTNSNILTNPFFILPSIALHALVEPSGWALRGVAALSSVLLWLVVYALVRPLYGAPTAWCAVVLSAICPLNFLYARIGWEPSQSVLFAWLVVLLSLGLARAGVAFWPWALAAGVAWGAALLVHPTNFFLAPVVGLAGCSWLWQRMSSARARWFLGLGGLLGLAGLLAVAYGALSLVPYYVRDQIMARWSGWDWGQELQAFFLQVARLFTGLEVATAQGASPAWRESWLGQTWGSWPRLDALFWALTMVAVGVTLAWGRKREKMLDRVLVAYVLVGLAVFFLLCGAAPLRGADRYGLWMLPGITLVWARAAGLLWESTGGWGKSIIAGLGLLLSVGSLGFFYESYFRHFQATGGSASLASRTAAVEPKRQVAERARAAARESQRPLVVASEDWFMIWPVAYFLERPREMNSPVRAIFLEPWKRLGTLEEYEEALRRGEAVWRVEFADKPALEAVRAAWREEQRSWTEERILDAGGREVVVILKTPAS